MSSKECTIHIKNGRITLTLKDKPLTTSKEISLNSLAKLIGQIGTSSPLLSTGCRVIASEGEMKHYCIECGARIAPMTIQRNGVTEIKKQIYYPNNIFIFSFYGDNIISSYCVCSIGTLTSLDDKIFRTPFGNTYEDGRICWGENDLTRYSPSNLDLLTELYYTSPFNGELDDLSFINIDACTKSLDLKCLRPMGKFSEVFPQFRR